MVKKTNDPVEDDAGTAQVGDNSDAEADLIRQHAKAIIAQRQVIQSAQKVLGRLRKEAKADGLTLGTLDAMIRLLEMSPDEQRVFFSEHHTYAEALHIAHVPVGSQLDLLDANLDPEVRSRDWRARGFSAATTGKGVPGVPPAECPPEHHQDWLSGWNDGQAVNAPARLVEPEAA